LEIDDPDRELSPGIEVSARIHLPVADVEPFRSQPTDPEPLGPSEPRSVFVCPEHGDVLGQAGGKCPRDGLALVEQPLAENQRLRYWCPMHPTVTAAQPGEKCDACKGMVLLPRVVTYRPHGEVLAVPESAVIDTGKGHVVYVDRGEGMFEGVEVVVGPRAAGHYAIYRGLEAGQKVAAAGAFLLDAETRLNPNASAAYFGATK
jgi:Cu(I)/Ag(I) efflux system membrane fusion protein